VRTEKNNKTHATRRYGSERDVYALTGIPPRTLQKHRLFGKGFPWYRVGGRVMYDLAEVEACIQAGRIAGALSGVQA
jgi:hypothetical protein